MKEEKNEIKSTAHSRYRCQYHIVFAPKYRRKEIYGELRRDIGEILRTLCKQKGVEIYLKRPPVMVMRCQTFNAPFRGQVRNCPF